MNDTQKREEGDLMSATLKAGPTRSRGDNLVSADLQSSGSQPIKDAIFNREESNERKELMNSDIIVPPSPHDVETEKKANNGKRIDLILQTSNDFKA